MASGLDVNGTVPQLNLPTDAPEHSLRERRQRRVVHLKQVHVAQVAERVGVDPQRRQRPRDAQVLDVAEARQRAGGETQRRAGGRAEAEAPQPAGRREGAAGHAAPAAPGVFVPLVVCKKKSDSGSTGSTRKHELGGSRPSHKKTLE